MKQLVIVRTGRAMLPEVHAYQQYFENTGRYACVVVDDLGSLTSNADAVLVFMGWFPRWRARKAGVLIGDANSRSVGPRRLFADSAKRLLNARPEIGVALNEWVAAGGAAQPRGPLLVRGMGYFPEYVVERRALEWDVVYSGTLQRKGVVPAILRLSQLGLRVLVVGDKSPELARHGVDVTGQVSLQTTYEYYSRCLAGLNLVPDTTPFRYQDSTKLIEYSAAGIGTVTTSYPWAQAFEYGRGGRFLALAAVTDAQTVRNYPFVPADVRGLEWSAVIERSGLLRALDEQLAVGDVRK